jgi:hypothetical protein
LPPPKAFLKKEAMIGGGSMEVRERRGGRGRRRGKEESEEANGARWQKIGAGDQGQ